jgi:two-component system, cell cycle sensor histidine kinase and response regulator CckA
MSCIILLAEDDVVVRNSARLLLQAEGHEVLVATDGQEALKLSREYQGPIEMLLTAVKMPGMDGLALVAQIVKERPGIKTLVMSGKIGSDEVSGLPFLRKPFSPAAFRDKVREVLSKPGPAA